MQQRETGRYSRFLPLQGQDNELMRLIGVFSSQELHDDCLFRMLPPRVRDVNIVEGKSE